MYCVECLIFKIFLRKLLTIKLKTPQRSASGFIAGFTKIQPPLKPSQFWLSKTFILSMDVGEIAV